MKSYQINCILKKDLKGEEIKKFTVSLKKFFKEGKNENLTKINLAYPIKKEIQGYLYSIDIISDEEKIKELEEYLRKEEKVLRFNIIKIEK